MTAPSSADDPPLSSSSIAVEPQKYRALVIDSGPIIRLTADVSANQLWSRAEKFYTVPAVWAEIRDAKARQYLENSMHMDKLQTREPSRQALQAVVEFSRQTGDYPSLSSVDLQVLALLYELEGEFTDMKHVRKTPKRTVSLGKIEQLGTSSGGECQPQPNESAGDDLSEEKETVGPTASQPTTEASSTSPIPKSAPKTWANLVNPAFGSNKLPDVVNPSTSDAAPPTSNFSRLSLQEETTNDQFADAESDNDSSADEASFDSQADISDEECDVYILDPDEVEAKHAEEKKLLEQDLQSDFPSLAASRLVPYEDSDNDGDDDNIEQSLEAKEAQEQQRKAESLKPKSNSGKLYNSFRKYGDLMKPKPVVSKRDTQESLESSDEAVDGNPDGQPLETNSGGDPSRSRILGGIGMSGQELADFEDDGEGWISTTKEIKSLQATGGLNPAQSPASNSNNNSSHQQGPPISQRAACATTDFAMQNVILQMNLELLSVDGVKIRKLKSWVMRCGACYKVYTNASTSDAAAGPLGKRLFCDHCGSDMMQRIAASVDGKTGRLRLHFSKHYKHNLRGTKYSLPKPGTGNRFQGDLLLREDQLMMGAWNQKVKMRSGGKARSDAQSIFGRDIASNVGCHASSASIDDIRVGFGRRNPNAAKGRERRGKKKKSSDRACGLRRY